MDVVAEILKWGKQRLGWQQTALQLIYERRVLSESDISTLVALAQKEQGLPAGDVTGVQLTLAGDAEAGLSKPVVLLGVEDVVNSNALGRDQLLSFASNGLTLVFGDNGTGKSGYVRILKQVCRARGDRDTVYPHAFVESGEPTKATIRFAHGDTGDFTFTWTPAASGPSELHQVSILDGKAAFVYVDGQQDVAYLPFGLDLFPRLAGACGRVSSALEQEINAEQRSRDRFTEIPTDTAVGILLGQIEKTSIRKPLEKLSLLSDEESARADQLRAEVAVARAGQAEGRSAELELRARRVKSLAEAIASAWELVGPEAEEEYTKRRVRAADLAAGATQAATKTFAEFPLRGLGSDSWNQLWKAAREFAERGAEPRQVFPTSAGERCVLCQQPLDTDAAARLAAFHRFVSDSLAQSADEAASDLSRMQVRVREAGGITDLDPQTAEEIELELKGASARVAQALAGLSERRRAIVDGAVELPAIPEAIEAIVADLRSLEQQVRERAATLHASQDAEVLKARQRELAELEARISLQQAWGRVEAELERFDRVRKLRAAQASTSTTGITLKAKELFDAAVTAPLAERFSSNVQALGITHVPVEFAPAKGRKGMALHQVQLACKLGVDNKEILSEGEARAVAIAGFLSEVQLQEDASTIVFDDPVSSLDLGRREFVAKALVDLAERRPVVVFTHDMPFAWQLHECAKLADVEVTERQLSRTKNEAGLVSNSIGGSGLGARKRIRRLKQRAVDLKKVEAADRERYEREARVLYGELREVWERGVEDVLLQGGVRRFGREVRTKSFGKLHLLQKQHVERLHAGMTKCSGLLFGHDQPAELGRPIPDADELAADVAECEAWLDELNKLFTS